MERDNPVNTTLCPVDGNIPQQSAFTLQMISRQLFHEFNYQPIQSSYHRHLSPFEKCDLSVPVGLHMT